MSEMHAVWRTAMVLGVSGLLGGRAAARPPPWVEGPAAGALLRPWSTCDGLAEAVAPQRDGETLRARQVPHGVDVNRYSAGSGRWATAFETTLRLLDRSCSAVGFAVSGGKESLLAALTLVALGGAAEPTLEQLRDLASAVVVGDPDRTELAAARMLMQLAGDPPGALPATGILGGARPVQPEHVGLPRGAPASLWSPAALAAAGVAAPPRNEDGSAFDAMLAWPVRPPVALITVGRWQLWELRFRARAGGGMLAVYDRRSHRHRWLWATESDDRAGAGEPGHFEILAFHGDLLLVRTRLDDHESLWAVDVARGITRPVERSGSFRAVPGGVEVTGEQGEASTIPFAALTP